MGSTVKVMPGCIRPWSYSLQKGSTSGAPWKYVPIPCPAKSSQTPQPKPSAVASIRFETSR
eukprot:9503667-Pyramimonas_sp.AAC.1